MYYIVGKNGKNGKNGVFVYDSEDCSCELIPRGRLNESGIDYEEAYENQCSLYKLVSMYNFISRFGFYVKSLVCYNIQVYRGSKNYLLDNILNVLLIRTNMFAFDYGLSGDYAILLYFSVELIAQSNVVDLIEFNNWGSQSGLQSYTINMGNGWEEIWGIIIPVQMLDYTLRLVKMHDLQGLFDAYDNIFDKKLQYRCWSKFNMYVYERVKDSLSNIRWGV